MAQKLLACNLDWSENPLTCCDNYDISQPLKLISLSRIGLKAVLDELSGSNMLCLFPCPVCACVCGCALAQMYDTAVVFEMLKSRLIVKSRYTVSTCVDCLQVRPQLKNKGGSTGERRKKRKKGREHNVLFSSQPCRVK